ncbi:MAG: AAA family ATPase [Candidatus Pacearchaeota archaeon]|jgi:septum site-determining protein MinD
MKKKGNSKKKKDAGKISSPKIIGIIALKGGVGKTTVVSNLGATLSKEFGKKVLIVDANFSTPHLGLHVGLVNPDNTLHSVLNNDCEIKNAIYIHDAGFHIIPGQLMPDVLNPRVLRTKLKPLKEMYDVILIDSSPSLDKEIIATMMASDELLVVSTPDYPTLSSTIHAVKIAQEKGTPIKGLVLNRVNKKKFELTQKDISSASDVNVLVSLPENLKIQSAVSKMIPAVISYPKADVSKRYKKLASLLTD